MRIHLLLLSTFLLLVKTGKGQIPPNSQLMVLEGHLDHAPAADTVYLNWNQREVKTVLSETGDFKISVNGPNKAGTASISYARQHAILYLTPGDKLRLQLDFPQFEKTLRFNGFGASVNNYLAKSLWHFRYDPTSPKLQDQRKPTTTAVQMYELANAFRLKRRTFLKEYAATNSLPAAFYKQELLDIDLERAQSLLEYPGFYQQANGQVAKMPSTYFDFLRELPINVLDAQVRREPVIRFLSAYGGRLLPDGPLRADAAEVRRLYAQATRDLGSGTTRDWAMYQMLTFQPAAAMLAAYPVFKTHNQDSALALNMRKIVHNLLRVQPGQLAPAFTLRDNAGRVVSLQDFRGKVVYLDFWGTWCAPCRQELPASAKLAEQFSARGVVFVSIAINDKHANWVKVVEDEHVAGSGQVALFSPDPATAMTYNVQSFPAYFIVGRDGRLKITNAPRPSSAEAATALEQALLN